MSRAGGKKYYLEHSGSVEIFLTVHLPLTEEENGISFVFLIGIKK